MSLVIKILRAKRINILSETLIGETRNYNGKVKKNQAKCMQKKGSNFILWAIKIYHFEIIKHDNIDISCHCLMFWILKFTREVGIDIVDHYN